MFNRNRPDRDDRAKMKSFWQGRGTRAEYGAAVIASAVLIAIFHARPYFAPGLIVFFSVRRLHDFGRTGWWVLLPPSLIGLVLLLAVAVRLPGTALLVAWVAMAVSLGFVGFVGLMPGDDGPNRFGDRFIGGRRKPQGFRPAIDRG